MPVFPDSRSGAPDGSPSAHDAALRAGDREAFRAFFDETWDSVVAYATALSRDGEEAEDVVQEAFVRLWDRRASIGPDIPCRAYLYRTVRNLTFNRRRDAATRGRLLEDPAALSSAAAPGATAAPDTATIDRELTGQVAALVADLPPRQREALLLSRVHGLSHAEVSAAMGCAPRTVNNHLVAALQTLRTKLTASGALVAALACWIV